MSKPHALARSLLEELGWSCQTVAHHNFSTRKGITKPPRMIECWECLAELLTTVNEAGLDAAIEQARGWRQ